MFYYCNWYRIWTTHSLLSAVASADVVRYITNNTTTYSFRLSCCCYICNCIGNKSRNMGGEAEWIQISAHRPIDPSGCCVSVFFFFFYYCYCYLSARLFFSIEIGGNKWRRRPSKKHFHLFQLFLVCSFKNKQQTQTYIQKESKNRSSNCSRSLFVEIGISVCLL